MKLLANPLTPLALAAILLTLIPSLSWAGKVECLDRQDWDEKMSIEQYMEDCDAALTSLDGCRLNIEKACINGVEVDLANSTEDHSGMKALGFRGQSSNGVKRSDFLDPSKMYTTSKTPGNRDLKLCSKVEGLTESEAAQMRLNNLPKDKDFVIESVPAFINPRPDVASTSFHWKMRVTNGTPFIEAEIRSLNNLDNSTSGENNRPDLTKASGQSFYEIFKKFLVANLVRCKKDQTFNDSTGATPARSLGEFPEQLRQSIAESHAKVVRGLANSGLDTAALTRNIQRILNVPATAPQADSEESAPPPHNKPHAKGKSRRLH